jgi:lipopolysaccharide transport system ATP-binding protein
MTLPAIKVEGLWKEYQIGRSTAGMTFRETIIENVKASLRQLTGRGNAKSRESFWALQDVSFEIAPGEVVGIIGRNGAGKSTLLKILSRITAPTKGHVEIRGRVASLLEVGTGFHQELTGRENIRLNGAILGMSSREIRAKFDEIVAFSGVEKFLDTPVKRYSSGMQIRLAFAVAAHLDPDILVVDEVLAVGDAEFQKKCLGKMTELDRLAPVRSETRPATRQRPRPGSGICGVAVSVLRRSAGRVARQRICRASMANDQI